MESKNYNKVVNKTNEKADSQGKNKFHLRGKSKRGKKEHGFCAINGNSHDGNISP